jgi:hypothetical protein
MPPPAIEGEAQPERQQKHPGRFWRQVLYLLYLLLIVELALQIFHYMTTGYWLIRPVGVPIFAPSVHRPWSVEKEFHYWHKTSEYQALYITNKQGFRVDRPSRLYECPKPSDIYRILLMGPSFAFGWANDFADTYGARLEAILQKRLEHTDRTVEVINAGVPGLHALAQREWFDEIGGSYEADVVILMIYGDMAFVEELVAPGLRADQSGYLVPVRQGWTSWVRRLARRSGLAFYGYTLYRHVTQPDRVRLAPTEVRPGQLRGIESFDPESPWAKCMIRHLIAFREAVERADGRLMVVHVPMSYVVYPEDIPRWKSMNYTHSPESVALFNAAACKCYTEVTEIPCLDLTPSLKKAAKDDGDRLYFKFDVHWTPRGNSVAAETTARVLLSEQGRCSLNDSPESRTSHYDEAHTPPLSGGNANQRDKVLEPVY